MKNFIKASFSLFVFTLLLAPCSQAAFSIPGYVYSADQISSAQEEARAINQPITFLYADKNTTCGLGSAAAVDVINNLRKISVLVYVEAGRDWASLPSIIHRALHSDEAGKYIPKAIISNADITEVVHIIPYARKKQRKNVLRRAINAINNY